MTLRVDPFSRSNDPRVSTLISYASKGRVMIKPQFSAFAAKRGLRFWGLLRVRAATAESARAGSRNRGNFGNCGAELALELGEEVEIYIRVTH